MQIKYSPQRSDHTLIYSFNGEQITASLDGIADNIDLSAIGQYPAFEQEIKLTQLPINPIVSVQINNGIKQVEILKFYAPSNIPESERFGFDWQEV